tara:strand:- start:2010 stop:2228 length:219 start_codon:yes stop_codon:yes gene_type:complete
MGRVIEPDLPAIRAIQKENKIPDTWVFSWKKVRRCYIRIDGVMKAQGWLIDFQSSYYKSEAGYEEKQVFLPD